ncbi:MAG: hypothetical protein J7604_12375 [Sporocytophaga sp.]|uniref:hypothetical protein n=1 Tax=Sporocytophaga sp. TaxID=2231183 RepID=UPI001B04F640|nr:hypothetical protein [Sporocytophaga sp.]MBO9701000.1 hypothetical protein [Sporocytophaga sp.]
MIRVFFLFLLCTNVYGQIDTNKISITTKQYYEYEYDHGNFVCEIDYDSVISEEKVISYPLVKTPDETLNIYLNTTIRKTAGVYEFKGSKKVNWNYKCEDRPSGIYLRYDLNYKNSMYLSFTFYTDEYSGAGSSSNHDWIALTFDLGKRKTLLLKDVIKTQFDTNVYNISISQLKKTVPTLFEEYGEVHNPQLFHFTSALNFPVAIKKEGVAIYWNLSWGIHFACEEVIIPFDKYAHIFDKGFLTTVMSK